MTAELALELYGVRIRISAPRDLLDQIKLKLAYGREIAAGDHACRPSSGEVPVIVHMGISARGGAEFVVTHEGEDLLRATADGAVEYLESQIRQQVSTLSPEKIFLHAGVVGFQGSAIVIPGVSHSGKTSLVAALVKAGASYLSDEYAVLDAQGLAHPFAKPLSIRSGTGESQNYPVESLGGVAADSALPVRLVVFAPYRALAEWKPVRLSGGDAILALLRHTAQARQRPADALAALKRVVEDAVVLSGERGEAADIAHGLLQELASTR